MSNNKATSGSQVSRVCVTISKNKATNDSQTVIVTQKWRALVVNPS